MMILENDRFGLLKTHVDVHLLGMSTIKMFLEQSGYEVIMAPKDVMVSMTGIGKINNNSRIIKWIRDKRINVLSFSYRLDPKDGMSYFLRLYNLIKENRCFVEDGGSVKVISIAGLPDTCELVKRVLGENVIYFPGNETPIEALSKYGIPKDKYPKAFTHQHPYDRSLFDFAGKFLETGTFRDVSIPDHYGYKECGTEKDSYIRRLEYCKKRNSLPIIRVHAGPYLDDRLEAVKEFKSWVKELAATRFLDVLSIGSSQLTQSNFGDDWEGLANGGGVPINSELEYIEIAELAKPMLVRTYAGTRDVPWMAQMHERTLNISWHALSYWWFCELDGRGSNTVLENIREHVEAIKYIATTGKPLEPNVPHHFSFRGGDDVTYIVSSFLAAKTAKKYGIKHLILQNMLNTPKYTWGIEDLAKGRTMLKLVRELEDRDFRVSLQSRIGLDYFSTDLEKAKVQLAAITAMMDDIDPSNYQSPEIIHVVSYSEAVRLATPQIIEESIKITLGALYEYRKLKKQGKTYNTIEDLEIVERQLELEEESRLAIDFLEKKYVNLYTPEGLYKVFEDGYLPVPYILDEDNKFPLAKQWNTTVIEGSVKIVDDDGNIIPARQRFI